jgi:hypothetical protein
MAGYREPIELDGYQEEPDEPGDPQTIFLWVGALGLGFLLLLDVILWLEERGGVVSIISALAAVDSGRPFIDVDKSGLRIVFMIVCWLAVFAFCRALGIPLDISTRGKALLPVLAIVGGGFILDGSFGEPIITHYMDRQGYSRCVAGDWDQGPGKSHVWFAHYVLRPVDCAPHKLPMLR